MLDDIGSITNGIIAVVVLFGACVFFHELGHYTLATLIGMRVHEFAIGFGRRLWGFRRGETDYRINLIPLGGYVRIAGMEPGATQEERGFYTFPRWQGTTVLLAGSVMNVVLAALTFTVIGIAVGVPAFPGHTVNIRKVLPGSPARQAGMQSGDRITAIDGMTDSLLIEEVDEGGRAVEAGLRRYDDIRMVDGREVGMPLQLVARMIAAEEEGRDSVEADILRHSEDGEDVEVVTAVLPLPDDLPAQAMPGEAGAFVKHAFGVEFVPLGHDSTQSYISDRPATQIVLTVERDGRLLDIPVVPKAEWDRVVVEDERGRLTMSYSSVGRFGVVL